MLKQIVKEIKKANKIALFHHINPDGDSISSSYGLLLAIKSKFPNKEVVFVANPDEMQKLFPNWDIKPEHMVSEIDDSYLTIVGDAAISERIAYFAEYAKGYKKIVFDHHKIPIEPNFECSIYWREESFIASAMQATMIAKKLSVKFNQEIAFGLMIGLVTDSGQFTYSANDARVVMAYADLIKNVSAQKMIDFYNNSKQKTKEDIKLTEEILANIKYANCTSYVVFDNNFIKKHGREEIKAKLGAIGNIKNYPIWTMILEKEDNSEFKYDVSLRSNQHSIMPVAQKYGGGGHDKASGCKLKTKSQIKQIIADLDELCMLKKL